MKTTRYSIRDARYSARISRKESGNYAAAPEIPKSRVHLYILMFCLTFVPLNLLVSLTSIASANTATQIQQPLPEEGLTTVQDSNSPRMQELMRAQMRVIDAYETPQSKQSGNRLKQIIEQVRSVQFGSEQQPVEAKPAAPSKGAVAEPARSAPETTARREDPNEEIKTLLSRQQVTGETLKMLKDLLPHPEKLDRPLDMGEVLFSSGNLADAAVFYQEALKRANPNDPNASGDRAWILFQIGNCLRNNDRPAASKMYGQLLSEYPQSPWTYMAQAEGKLIEWYLKDNPHTLIGAGKTQRPKTQ